MTCYGRSIETVIMTKYAQSLQAKFWQEEMMKQAAIFEVEAKQDILQNYACPHMTILKMMEGLNRKIWMDNTPLDKSFHSKWDEVILLASEEMERS